ncbi:MAG: RNA methyltransferase [Desulfitobacterium sp.]
MGDLYIALIHAPVYNKNMETIATSITNLDIHDIARSSTTYGVKRYYIVHPAQAQQELARRIMGYWQEGFGAEYNPNRQEAFARVKLLSELAEVEEEIYQEQGRKPLKIATDARRYPNTLDYATVRAKIEKGEDPMLLLFGTGWGLHKDVMASCDIILEPIYGPGEWNHLSVRSAAAIILDRLRGH